MAIKSDNELKQFYMTGKKPSQQQFWDWIDSKRHKNEKITISDLDPALLAIFNTIQGLPQVATLTADGYVEVPAACDVRKITLIAESNSVIDLGTTAAGTQIEQGAEIMAGLRYRILPELELSAAGRIYCTGITSSTQIIIYKD
jgi:hypothetical protein